MMPIAQRILCVRNDAKMAGHRPAKCHISPLDMKELKSWVLQQNRPNVSGLPPQNLSTSHLWGLEIVEDSKVKDMLILEMVP